MADTRYHVDSGGSKAMVSVIILNYNGREHLDACLSSLLDLAFPKDELEIIVVDNASTDDSVEFITSRFPNVVLIQNQANLGFSRAANIGAAHAQGRYFAFLNNDMRVDTKWLSILVEIARAENGFACVGSTVLNWDGTALDFAGRADDAFCLAYESTDNRSFAPSAAARYTPVLFVSGGAKLIQREIFQKLGGFDPDFFFYHEDVDLGWRLWLRGCECAISTESIVYHRGGATSSKLPLEFVQTLSQKHALFTIFKNLDDRNLREVLPLLLFFFLERGRWVPEARKSLALAIKGFVSSLDSLVTKRNNVQMTRVRSDGEIFAQLGNPCGFLLHQGSYDALRTRLIDSAPYIDIDPNDPNSWRAAIFEWLNRAHFLYESNLIVELERASVSRARELSAQSKVYEQTIRARDVAIAQLQGTGSVPPNEGERLHDEVSEYQEEIERLADSYKRLKGEHERNEFMMEMLSPLTGERREVSVKVQMRKNGSR